ncbi:kelch-like protein 33 [Poeciliopsis prolifica]|uniref:kelch-like protein 33 n=1 Tax=Poeciliopsis prolifica TaxID=188132 RepID=UPI00241443D4|nr:kelch-like protein 33 [Poeciliopsis prolifica]
MERKREVEESRRKRWRGRICYQDMAAARVEEKEDEAEEEGKDASSFKKVNEEEGSREAGEPEKEKEEKSDHSKRREGEEIAEANTEDETDKKDDTEWEVMECEEIDEGEQVQKEDESQITDGLREEREKEPEEKERMMDGKHGDESEETRHLRREPDDTCDLRKQINETRLHYFQQNEENGEQRRVKCERDGTCLSPAQSVCNEDDQSTEKQNQDELNCSNNKSRRSHRIINQDYKTLQSSKDKSKTLTCSKMTESWKAQEETGYDVGNLQEDANGVVSEDPLDEDENEEDGFIKMYYKDDYPATVFLALKEFRDSFTLTDLTLNTEDGRSICVHSTVLAAVSSLIWVKLSERKAENSSVTEDKPAHAAFGGHGWSVSLGPEVDCVGLEAVVEFAYTGLILCLNEQNVDQIQVAARAMGSPRVLALCHLYEEKPTLLCKDNKRVKLSAAEQMRVNLESIKQLWMDRVGCDVRLDAIGGSVLVHRVILAVSSDYFRGMFTLGMKESLQSCVSLPFLLASDLEVLIGSSYNGALPLNWTGVFEIACLSLQLQYQPALSLGFSFLQQEINAHTCLDVVSFAEAYEMAHLLEAADDFVLRQFQQVAHTSKFKDLPAKQLLKYLNSNSLCVSSELVVFNAVVSWIQAKPSRRIRLADEFMKTVQFSLMTFKEFKEVQSQNIWCDHILTEVYRNVSEDFCCNRTPGKSQCRIYQPKESLVLIGGDQISEDLCSRSISRDVWFGNSVRSLTGTNKVIEWRRLGEMPASPRFSHEVALLDGQLYILGGKKYYGKGDIFNSVYRYSPLQNSWESLCEMQEKRSSFSVVVLDGRLYAIGGYCEPDHMDTVECYCPTTNSWRFACPLELPLGGHVAKISKGQIFISGGQNSDQLCVASMFLYHPETGSTFLTSMSKSRAHHSMEALGEHLYVAGGISTNDNVTVIDQLACEMYSPAADSWTAFTSLQVPHVGAGSAVLEGKFYLLGGYSQEDFSDTNMVHRYDNATQKWENMGQMPGPNNEIRACVLRLPQHLRM